MEQSRTPMGLALALPGSNPVLKAHPTLTVTRGPYTCTPSRHAETRAPIASPTALTPSLLPIRWGFGANAQTWVLERDGKFYESLVSFYPAINGLDITTGDEKLTPHTVEEAFGRELSTDDARTCFGCHATAILN